MGNLWNNIDLIKIFIKWKWHISIITFIGMILICATTFWIKPLYESNAIIYPVNLSSFSEENYTEQMFQILTSRDIADKMIKKYNLIKYYEIDTSNKYLLYSVYRFFYKRVSISKTEYDAVKINVLDTKPEVAKEMVNSIIDFYNAKVREMHRIKTKEVMDLAQSEMFKWKLITDSLSKELQFYKTKYNIQDVNIQLENLTQGIYRARGNQQLISKAEKQIELLAKYGTEFNFLNNQYKKAYELYNANKLAFKNAEKEYNKIITYETIIQKPYTSYKKVSPKRGLITILGGISVFVLTMLIIIFLERNTFATNQRTDGRDGQI